jgi:hypothetical protein
MALKGERVVIETDITRTCESVAGRGIIVGGLTAGSGVALGASAGKGDVFASGMVPAGLLMNDVVNVDESRYHRNFHKDEMKIGERATLLRKGRVTTDQVTGTPTDGAAAYATTNGQLTPTLSATGGLVATPKVGQFRGVKDEGGFVTVDVMLPQ